MERSSQVMDECCCALNLATIATWFPRRNNSDSTNNNDDGEIIDPIRDFDFDSIVCVGSYEHKNAGEREKGEGEERVGNVQVFKVVSARRRGDDDYDGEDDDDDDDDYGEKEVQLSSSSKRRRLKLVGEMEETQRERCGGAFDIKFMNKKNERKTFAMACANDRLEVFQMDFVEDRVELKSTISLECGFGEIGLCTSAAWSMEDKSIVCTGDDGAIIVLDYERSDEIFRIENAHDDAIWASSFLDKSEDVFFTGGDDCKLKRHDLRELGYYARRNEEGTNSYSYASAENNSFRFEKNPVFGAGVTSIESRDHFVYVGSYDGVLRAFDARKSLKEPIWFSKDEENEDCSIWRVRLHPNKNLLAKDSTIALASMKAGCRIVRASDGTTVSTYNGHDNDKVVYGCDWAWFADDADNDNEGAYSLPTTLQKDSNNDERSLSSPTRDHHPRRDGFVSCSFYDKKIHLWH